MLERLRCESDPVEVLASVPGVGKRLAERLYADLGIDTLEELEAAAHVDVAGAIIQKTERV
jgi:Holliday junction resolvasome RuvABC DNA-binding subunit